ncbi:isatin hydrolase-like [Clytia hemisphaerica]|uniref:Uncharacterized protein n=1 Tax=Clytia hemisphaerica TaxID=252671 RepID=A0A7M5WV96_9CNID|eukprot:TCONS_00068531-protein
MKLHLILMQCIIMVIATDINIIDLTHEFENGTSPYWKMENSFHFTSSFSGQTANYFYSSNSFCASEHGGTHLDAPIHFAKGKHTAGEISLKNLIATPFIVDVSSHVNNDPDFQVDEQHLMEAEKKNGKIPDGAILLLYTGLSLKYDDLSAYFGGEPQNSSTYHFPGLHPNGARWIVDNRNVSAVGIDTPSLDFGQSTLFQSHVILFTHNIPGFENVDLTQIEKIQSMKNPLIIALPMKIKNGSGGPLRIVAMETPTAPSASMRNVISLFMVLACFSFAGQFVV